MLESMRGSSLSEAEGGLYVCLCCSRRSPYNLHATLQHVGWDIEAGGLACCQIFHWHSEFHMITIN